MQPPVSDVMRAHAVLGELLESVDDAQVAAPSLLPDWSRGHVLAHLIDNARMFRRLAEHALRDELVPTYDGGVDERNAIIEATATHSADEHRRALAEQTRLLEEVWARFERPDWQRPVTFRNADVGATVFARWREVWIHSSDLGLGLTPGAWPAELAAHSLDFLLSRLPAGVRLRAEDTGQEWTTGAEIHTSVTGEVRDLAVWLAGRTPTSQPQASPELPTLGPWPPHPQPDQR